MKLSPEFDVEATAIDDAREAAYAALRAANERGLTGADVEAMQAAMADIDARCERLRVTYFPRRHQLFVALGAALVVSRTGRRREIVWSRPDRPEREQADRPQVDRGRSR